MCWLELRWRLGDAARAEDGWRLDSPAAQIENKKIRLTGGATYGTAFLPVCRRPRADLEFIEAMLDTSRMLEGENFRMESDTMGAVKVPDDFRRAMETKFTVGLSISKS